MNWRLIKKCGNIIRGYWFLLWGMNDELSRTRVAKCMKCDLLKRWFCKNCGCFIPAKTRVKDESCPLGKW